MAGRDTRVAPRVLRPIHRSLRVVPSGGVDISRRKPFLIIGVASRRRPRARYVAGPESPAKRGGEILLRGAPKWEKSPPYPNETERATWTDALKTIASSGDLALAGRFDFSVGKTGRLFRSHPRRRTRSPVVGAALAKRVCSAEA